MNGRPMQIYVSHPDIHGVDNLTNNSVLKHVYVSLHWEDLLNTT